MTWSNKGKNAYPLMDGNLMVKVALKGKEEKDSWKDSIVKKVKHFQISRQAKSYIEGDDDFDFPLLKLSKRGFEEVQSIDPFEVNLFHDRLTIFDQMKNTIGMLITAGLLLLSASGAIKSGWELFKPETGKSNNHPETALFLESPCRKTPVILSLSHNENILLSSVINPAEKHPFQKAGHTNVPLVYHTNYTNPHVNVPQYSDMTPHSNSSHSNTVYGPHTNNTHSNLVYGPHSNNSHSNLVYGPHTNNAHTNLVYGPHSNNAHSNLVNVGHSDFMEYNTHYGSHTNTPHQNTGTHTNYCEGQDWLATHRCEKGNYWYEAPCPYNSGCGNSDLWCTCGANIGACIHQNAQVHSNVSHTNTTWQDSVPSHTNFFWQENVQTHSNTAWQDNVKSHSNTAWQDSVPAHSNTAWQDNINSHNNTAWQNSVPSHNNNYWTDASYPHSNTTPHGNTSSASHSNALQPVDYLY